MRFFIATISLLSVITFESCYYDNEEELYDTTPNDTTTVSWVSTIKPIIDTKCAVSGCHVTGATSPNLSTYNGVFNARDRVKFRATVADNMPAAAPLPQDMQDKLTRWIDAGAANN